MSDTRSNTSPNPDDRANAGGTTKVLKGSWVGAFDALRLTSPPAANAQLKMQDYQPLTVMMCVKFDSDGNVEGETRRNVSSNEIMRDPFAGWAFIKEHPRFQWGEGAFTIERAVEENGVVKTVVNEVEFVLRSADEMQIILGKSSDVIPGNLAQCILRRVP